MDTEQQRLLIDFANTDTQGGWQIINDGVMGGLSQSEMRISNSGTAIFRGNVSLQNNGGFASTRTRLQGSGLNDYSGIVLRIRGDGKTYHLRLRTDNRFDGVSYRQRFDTEPDQWITVHLPFKHFEPVFRGRVLNDVGSLKPESIQQMGFLISDKQDGPFTLEVQWIKAYK
ncbi:MAG: CIA30 family protein [Caldithrix sp.]|nr:CIA30 family protein [Caldithrix sp.]